MNLNKGVFGVSMMLSSAAMAHQGDHSWSGLMHFLTEPDHVAIMMIALVATGAFFRKMKKSQKAL
ncbi:hypothetical protein [Parendozoicomonas sp. Alg238-R29]|uniref:hypothetical protein n=1 Tax=Parendozoicomonas sp. Alg238-R29 TaxID=2993446 RepID=UPI00248F0A3E|nr:hypothetical protein [Parendozoicomonas sp. Alg238-R29]